VLGEGCDVPGAEGGAKRPAQARREQAPWRGRVSGGPRGRCAATATMWPKTAALEAGSCNRAWAHRRPACGSTPHRCLAARVGRRDRRCHCVARCSAGTRTPWCARRRSTSRRALRRGLLSVPPWSLSFPDAAGRPGEQRGGADQDPLQEACGIVVHPTPVALHLRRISSRALSGATAATARDRDR